MTAPVQQDPATVAAALETARELTRAGIPVFAAAPSTDPKNKIGFTLPPRWQQLTPDPAWVDAWQPGWALIMVCGHGLDLLDLDLYAGADMTKLDGLVPRAYGAASTASGGLHLFIASIGVNSKNGLFKGIDIKSGTAGGKGRGFAFIAPTVKPSKITGEPGAYIWAQLPDLAALAAAAGQDQSGAALAAVMTAKKAGTAPPNGNSPAAANGSSGGVQAFLAQQGNSPWADIEGTLKAGRNDGVMRLAASLRQREAWDAEQAITFMMEHVWPLIDQGQGEHEFSLEEFGSVIRAVWRQYDGPAEQVAAAARMPDIPTGGVDVTDSYLVDRIAYYVLGGRFAWAAGLGWLRWDEHRWETVTDHVVHDAVRRYFIWLHREAAMGGADSTLLQRLSALLSRARIAAVTLLTAGHPSVYCRAADFDAHPDLLNTPGGVVNLHTGEISEHDPALRLTKITKGNYRPGFTHPDWDAALTALDESPREWFRGRIGQAVTGWPPSDGIMPVLQGSGENGKTCVTTDGPVIAFGDYAQVASSKLITSQSPGRSEHSTEMADLRGQRLLIGEELSEGRSIDVTALKRIQDVGMIKARYVHKDNISFPASHTLLITSNYIPVITETDHGTWRRLTLLRFRYTYRKPGHPCPGPLDRPGDPELKSRIRRGEDGQHDAIVTWAVEGARGWYERGMVDLDPPPGVIADTMTWRTTADRILGFWNEHLEADHEACILATEMLDAFNAWLGRNGHSAWARETFAPRFAGHEETARNGVEERRTARLGGLSRWPGGGLFGGVPGTPKQAVAWMGVKWKTPDDQGQSGQLAAVAQGDANVPSDPTRETFASGSATAATKIINSPAPPNDLAEVAEVLPDTPGNALEALPLPAPDARTPLEPDSAGTTVRKRKAKPAPKREGPDPELAGPVLSLPAIVVRDGRVVPCTLEQAVTLVSVPELTVDVETTGYSIGHPDYALRTVQLGHETVAAVFDAADPEHQEVIRAVLASAQVLHAHSAVADLAPLVHAGLCGEDAWDRMLDTVLPAKLADPAMSGSDADGLKQLAADVLGDYAVIPAANEARKKLFTSGKWLTDTKALTAVTRSGWAQVNPGCETMVRYAASDVLDTAALARVLPQPDPVILGRERMVQAVCARVSHRGLRLDHGHIRKLIAEHEAAKAGFAARCSAAGIGNPGSAQQVGRALADLGVNLPRTKPSVKFPQGQPSAAEAVLTPLAKAGGEAGQVAADVLEYRDHATVLSLTLEPFNLRCERGDGRVRSVIYTLGTDTGRMCLPDDHALVTQDGFAKPDEIRPGMLTLDAAGQWVRVKAVHRYQDQPLITLANRGLELAATPEHRWVTTLAHRPGNSRQLRALDDRPRLRVHLAPEVRPFDFRSRTIPAESDGQRFAALIGMLITDGRCAEGEPGAEAGLRSHVCQSERKFPAEFLRVIPDDALMYDRVKAGDHHELRIKSRWLRPRLDAAGITPGLLLRESASLHRWVATLPDDELRAFFAACWLADGGFAGADRPMGSRWMSCSSASLRGVLILAAYRLGVIAREVPCDPGSSWAVKPEFSLAFREPVITMSKTARGNARADVWCVTTETGTFTAVSPQGTVYLTGNSCVRENLQQLKRTGGLRACITADDGMMLISADFQAVELRTAAALSGDADLYQMILAGDDLHWRIARQVWGAGATKGDRYNAKRGVFGRLYGAGIPRIAATLGISEAEAQKAADTLDALAPGVSRWSAGLQKYVRNGGASITAYSGRVIWLDRQHPHKGANYAIQGSAREFLADAILRWRQTRWGNSVILPVHDEVLAVVPAAEAADATAALVACMQTQLNGMPIVAEASEPSFAWQDAA